MYENKLLNWREIKSNSITTDGLWVSLPIKTDDGRFIIPKRDIFNDFDNTLHGLFIPEIPFQFISRFAKDNGIIWDCFAGNGTTYYVAKKLGCENRIVCNDIYSYKNFIIQGDSRSFNPLLYTNNQLIDLVFCHPPYFNIIKFGEDSRDLSNLTYLSQFLIEMEKVAENINRYIKNDGYVILVCGNIWVDNEEIDLGVMIKDIFRRYNFKCKSHIIKDYGETKSRGNKYNLQYYRNLKNGTNFFYGDNIFMLRKQNGTK